ncbi:MAG: LuxR C-terminal-related transcriptional regulator [Thermoleophilia bacterium]
METFYVPVASHDDRDDWDRLSSETVLIIENDPETLRMLRDGLDGMGYRVLATTDGSNIRQFCRDERPDAIIVDFNLAGGASLDICKQIKADAAIKHIPVIFFEEHPERERVVAGFEVGAHDFVSSSLDSGEFNARLAAAVRFKQAFDRLRQQNSKLEALAKHVRAAVQHYEQPRALEGSVDVESDAIAGEAIVRLTRRETEILQLLARGLSNEVISKQLYISPTTTRNHIQNILGKLGVHSKLEAVAYAVRAGYVDFVG